MHSKVKDPGKYQRAFYKLAVHIKLNLKQELEGN